VNEKELYIRVGLTTLRCPDDIHFVDVPLYIRVKEIQPNGLAMVEEKLLETITEIISKHNENALPDKIKKLKNGGSQNGLNENTSQISC